jgi:hypothetical protein
VLDSCLEIFGTTSTDNGKEEIRGKRRKRRGGEYEERGVGEVYLKRER